MAGKTPLTPEQKEKKRLVTAATNKRAAVKKKAARTARHGTLNRPCTLPESPVAKADRVPRRRGRPTTCTQAVKDEVLWYVEGGFEAVGDPFPSIVGAACELNVLEEDLYRWAKTQPDMHQMLRAIKHTQKRILLEGGTNSRFNSTIAKLVLAQHGYSEKTDTTHHNPDGSLMQQPTTITIRGRPPEPTPEDTDEQ